MQHAVRVETQDDHGTCSDVSPRVGSCVFVLLRSLLQIAPGCPESPMKEACYGSMRDQRVRQHFAEIAPRYRKVRESDQRAVRVLAQQLAQSTSPGVRLRLLDVGTGTGRYLEATTAQLVRAHSVFSYAVGVDENPHMLLAARQRQRPDARTTRVVGDAEALPFSPSMFDAVLSFNAVHHFELTAFLREATRVLRPAGRLVIYTRTPEQNRRTIWGRYLPGFAERETRLHGVETLRDAIRETNALCDVRSLTMPWTVTTSLARLLQQARAFHYATFRLYSLAEFDEALEVFANCVVRTSGASNIAARNDHQLVLARRQPGESIIVPRWPLEAVASLAPAGFQHQTGGSDDKGRSSRRRRASPRRRREK